jgi:beta-galactosidase
MTALLSSLILPIAAAAAQPWLDPGQNSENREPSRTYTVPLADEKDALADELEPPSPYVKSLNGVWRFDWCGSVALKPEGFEAVGFDDSRWSEIDVPSCPEMRGWGAPQYTNIRYPFPARPPFVPETTNAVCSYRTTFVVPEGWGGREVFLRFEGVGSAATVWINGRKVGYTEDSYTPAEFNITRYIAPTNCLAVQVMQYCDGSYLEDQDFFRFYGIFRDVSIWSMPRGGIWDFRVATKLAEDFSFAEVSVEGIGGEWSATLYDAANNVVGELSGGRRLEVRNPRLWSAEDPYLYTFVLRAGEDIRSVKIGIREVRIDGSVIKVNGRPVKFHGVNRHETNPFNGRTVGRDEMLRDVLMFKRYNIDTVRTCHYPDHRLWYALCDKYGIYVMAEANVESHGIDASYRDTGRILGYRPEWRKAIVERNVRNALNWRNNPSVFAWSLGNESGAGENFAIAKAAVKEVDPTRPIHYEGFNEAMDMDARMYGSVDWTRSRAEFGAGRAGSCEQSYGGAPGRGHTASKPFFACEYSHAMGNALGNFQEYWDIFDVYDCMAGGCIWDWIDQSIWKELDRPGGDGRRERILAYGGDFDETPNDGPFCCNGLVGSDAGETPKLIEVAHVHRPLAIVPGADAATGRATLRNRFAFTRADEYDGKWELLENGRRIADGALTVPPVPPGACGEIALPRPDHFCAKPEAEYFYNVAFSLKRDEPWAGKGHVVARDQIPWRNAAADALSNEEPGVYAIAETEDAVSVSGEGVSAVFSRWSGTLEYLEMSGRRIIGESHSVSRNGMPRGPRLTCMRAFTDNDAWMRRDMYASGLSRLAYHCRGIEVSKLEGGLVKVSSLVKVTSGKSAGFMHKFIWTFLAGGRMKLETDAVPFGDFPGFLPRLGASMRLDPELENLEWYGRGPHENYVDRCTSAFFGVYRSTVSEQYVDYARPQECGSKTGTRWLEVTDGSGRGVRISGRTPFIFKALHYDWEDLEFARHVNGERRRSQPLRAQVDTLLDIDVGQMGLGGASCGPRPMDKYFLKPGPVSASFEISPASNASFSALSTAAR